MIKIVLVAPRIQSLFGCKNIVDWSGLSTTERTTDSFVHCDLAPSFGKLNKDSLRALDDNLKIMIAGTTRAIEKLPINQRTWEDVTSTLAQNPLLRPLDDGIARSDKLIKDHGMSCFKTDGSPDRVIVREVQTWFTSLISDDDVIRSTKIDIDVFAKIVAWTGAAITSFGTIFGKKEYHERTVVDIGILRYPDIDQPYFKLYRIKLTAWSDCRRVVFVQSDKNGITGQYNVRKYGPRESIIDGMKEETKKKAIQEAQDLFS